MFKVVVAVFTSVTVVDIEIKHIPIGRYAPIAAGKLKIDIMPTGLVIFHCKTAIPVTAVIYKSCSCIGASNRFYRTVFISRRYSLKEYSAVQGLCFNREINPHSKACCALKIYTLPALIL